MITPDTRFRAVAMYSCDPGFELKGPVKRECLYDGRWSGSAPVCRRKRLRLFHLPLHSLHA